jgi:high affinity sulfate transporter 1
VLPALTWLPLYERSWLRSDLIAGITLAAYAIPVSLAYASLAGVPPQAGIYCYLAGGLLYAAFGTSRQLAIGPTSAISMLVGATIAGMAITDPARWASIAALSALLVAVLSGVAYVLRLSTLVNFISETILLGFKAGAALTIAMTQLPKLFGVPGGGENFFERAWLLGSQLGETNWTVLALGLIGLAVLLVGEKLLPGRPVALLLVALAIAAASIFSLASYGVATVGSLPQGLPSLRPPSLRPRDVDGVVPLAAACFILAYIEGISAARSLAKQNDYEISPRTELLGLGMANLAAAFAQGFPVAGGLSQSVVNDKAGAKSPLALVFASGTLALCLLFLTGLLTNLPTVVLAIIVLVAVTGLIDLAELRHLYRVSRYEFAISMVAFAGVLLLGILRGVLLAVIVSLLMLLRSAAQPHVAILGRIPGSRRYSDLERHPDNESIPGVLIFRVEGPLLYFNADYVRGAVWAKVESAPGVRLVVCDLSNSPSVDVASARMLRRLHADLQARGIALRVVEAHARARDLLRAEGVEDRVGYLGRHLALDAVIAEHEQSADPSRAAALPEQE